MATLINGNGNLAIYAQQDADWYAALMGGQTVITAVGNQFAYELLDANTIGVKDGVIITTEGRRIQLDANAIDSFDIPTGAQGTTNYYIIGYHLVTGDLSEQTCETFVQLMENGTDTIPEGSFRDGDDEVFVSLYRVEQNDLTLGTITLLLPQLSGSFQSQITELNNDLTDKVSGFTETTYSAVTGLAYDSTNKKLGLKVGADTVIPFSGGMPWIINYSTYFLTNDGNWGNHGFLRIAENGSYTKHWVAANSRNATIGGLMILEATGTYGAGISITPLVNMKMIFGNNGGNTSGMNSPTITNLIAGQTYTLTSSKVGCVFIPSVN